MRRDELLPRSPYRAPELLNTQGQYDYTLATDIWSLGCILFELATEEEFYLPGSSPSVRIPKISEDAALQSHLSRTIQDLLRVDPPDRLSTDSLLKELEKLQRIAREPLVTIPLPAIQDKKVRWRKSLSSPNSDLTSVIGIIPVDVDPIAMFNHALERQAVDGHATRVLELWWSAPRYIKDPDRLGNDLSLTCELTTEKPVVVRRAGSAICPR